MLQVSENSFSKLQADQSERWVNVHVAKLTELAPDFAAMYPPDTFRALVIRMLNRGKRQNICEQEPSVAFCFASIKLGIGFEDKPEHSWLLGALGSPKSEWADKIWLGLHNAVGNTGTSAS